MSLRRSQLESRMPATGTSGLMSGDGKRGGAQASVLAPILDSIDAAGKSGGPLFGQSLATLTTAAPKAPNFPTSRLERAARRVVSGECLRNEIGAATMRERLSSRAASLAARSRTSPVVLVGRARSGDVAGDLRPAAMRIGQCMGERDA